MNIPLWTHMDIEKDIKDIERMGKGYRKDGKTFIRCYNIALKL